jgi:hypothetical protein
MKFIIGLMLMISANAFASLPNIDCAVSKSGLPVETYQIGGNVMGFYFNVDLNKGIGDVLEYREDDFYPIYQWHSDGSFTLKSGKGNFIKILRESANSRINERVELMAGTHIHPNEQQEFDFTTTYNEFSIHCKSRK